MERRQIETAEINPFTIIETVRQFSRLINGTRPNYSLTLPLVHVLVFCDGNVMLLREIENLTRFESTVYSPLNYSTALFLLFLTP